VNTNSPSPTSDQTPPRVAIDEVIKYGKKVLRNPQLPVGVVQMHSRRAKHRLKAIFGETPILESLFGDPSNALSLGEARQFVEQRNVLLESIAARLDAALNFSKHRDRVFFGHGASPLWRELKDFVADRLKLPWDEFNRTPVAGYTTAERLEVMLDSAAFAFLVMTAEEEHADETLHARSNVIHEVGLFQGRLGIRKAIVLLEEGCAEFSNIAGLSEVRFPRGRISAVFEQVRALLEREQLIKSL
jgi:hypothetical protein